MGASTGKSRSTQGPRLGELRREAQRGLEPGRLRDGDPADLRIDAYRDNERYDGVDLTGRQLSGLTLSECALVDVTVTEADLHAARVTDTAITRLNAPVLRAAHSVWRDVSIEHSRIGSGELYDAELNTVLITQSKLGFLNLRGAVLRDVAIEDCVIEELDLSEASASRLVCTGCSIAMLDVSGARLENVDLRGARVDGIRGIDNLRGVTVDAAQLMDLAPLLAAHLGIRVG